MAVARAAAAVVAARGMAVLTVMAAAGCCTSTGFDR